MAKLFNIDNKKTSRAKGQLYDEKSPAGIYIIPHLRY